MNFKLTLIPALIVLAAAGHSQDDPLAKYVYPLAKPLATPPVEIDVTDFPESKAWAEKAKGLVETWYPYITSLLSTQKWKAPKKITLIIKKDLEVPAYEENARITINGKWITGHPDDLGMVIHEMTHIIQDYPDYDGKPGWLVEGIADYTRWWRYEPEGPRPKLTAKNTYHDAYRVTAMFLAYAGKKYNLALVPALDLAMREKRDPMPVFKDLTGKTAQEIWDEMVPPVK